MMPIENDILLKNQVTCNFMLKYYIKNSLRKFTKTSNQFFHLSRANKILEICMPVWFVQLNESNQFWGNFIECFNKRRLFKKYKIVFSLKTAVCEDIIFIWLAPAMKHLPEKLYPEFPHALNFSCTWYKEASYCR